MMKLQNHSLSKRLIAPVTYLLIGDAAGSQHLGQNGGSTSISAFLIPNAATLAAGKSVQVRGVDLTTAVEVSPYAAGFVSNELVRESLVVFARPDTGAALRNAYVAGFDNGSATAALEPAGTAFLFGGFCLLNNRRRQHR